MLYSAVRETYEFFPLSSLPSSRFFLLAVGKASNGKVGYGDGILILVLGVWTGFLECLLTLTAGLLLASIWAAAALILKIHNKKDTIPFIPFLLIGYLARILI